MDDLATEGAQGVSPDEVIAVTDRDAIAMTLRLAREEAILVGGSTGVAVSAALRIARELGPGKRVVTVAPDTGRNYLCSYFDADWRSARGI